MVNMTVKLGPLTLNNPIMPGSGCFSEELHRVYDVGQLGCFVPKSIELTPRDGNPVPRVAETPAGMLNSIGLPTFGIAHFLEHQLPIYTRFGIPVVVSVSGATAEEFATICRVVSLPEVAGIEANISCPNKEEGGRAFAMDPDTTLRVMKAIKQATRKPVWAKLTPNTGDIAEVAAAAEEGGADALVVANTILGMAVDTETFRPKLGNVTGGLSGPAVKPIVVRLVYQCAKAVRIPIIASGGIMNAADVVEYLAVGATATQVGTANFLEPAVMPKIIADLRTYCTDRGFASIADLIGRTHRFEPAAALVA
jgi:dihydroorotate dehydrogenase (NAD+) catalytic subunit